MGMQCHRDDGNQPIQLILHIQDQDILVEQFVEVFTRDLFYNYGGDAFMIRSEAKKSKKRSPPSSVIASAHDRAAPTPPKGN